MTDHAEFLDATLPHLDVVWNLARRFARDHGAAEDLVQETYLRAFRGYGSKGAGETRAWLVAICLNTARSEFRRSQRRPREEADAIGRLVGMAGRQDVADEAVAALQREALEHALRELPAVQRVAVLLVDLAGLTAAEAAVILGAPRGTILSRVHRGRRSLARVLEQQRACDEV